MNLLNFFTKTSWGSGLLFVPFFVIIVSLWRVASKTTDSDTKSSATKMAVFAAFVSVPIVLFFALSAGSLIVLYRTPPGRAIVKVNEVVG